MYIICVLFLLATIQSLSSTHMSKKLGIIIFIFDYKVNQKNIYALLRGLDVIIWVMGEGNLQGF